MTETDSRAERLRLADYGLGIEIWQVGDDYLVCGATVGGDVLICPSADMAHEIAGGAVQ